MKIKTRLRLNSWFSLGVVILMLLSLAWSLWDADRAERNMVLTNEIQKTSFERIILRDEWLLNQEERARTQWHAKTETLRGLLESASQSFTGKEVKNILQDAQRDFETTSSLFYMLLEKHKRPWRDAKKKLDFAEAESSIISQVFLKAYSLNDNIGRLNELLKREANTARNKGTVFIIICFVVGIIAMIINSIAINRIMAKRLTVLNEGVSIIGGGNLDHQIVTGGDDELTALARASNEMAARLKGSYTSVQSLQREISGRKLAEDQIKSSLHEKEILLKEIHHRVKNNLQVVSSLLSLQSGYLKDVQAIEIFKESQNRVSTIAMIHAKLYQSKNLTEIDYADFIKDLAGSLLHTYGRKAAVRLNTDIRDVFLEIDLAIPCGLIVNELVTNALKHSFPEGKEGEIIISMASEDNRFVLKVKDNGIGFPEGVDFRNTSSLGLQLVNILIKQLHGEFDIEVADGTTFIVTFPVKIKEE